MTTQERTSRSRLVIGALVAVVIVVVLLLALALTGVASGLFAKQIDRTVRNDVDASGLVASLVSYRDSFRGDQLAAGRVGLGVQIDPTAVRGGDPAAQPATIVLRTYSCPGADGAPTPTRLTIEGADEAHVQVGNGVSLTETFEIVSVTPAGPGAPECRVDLAAR
jgi:hypothetical protein